MITLSNAGRASDHHTLGERGVVDQIVDVSVARNEVVCCSLVEIVPHTLHLQKRAKLAFKCVIPAN